jgi:hypothetical protein
VFPLALGAVFGAAVAVAARVARVRRLLPRPGRSDELETLTKEELYERARAAGISGRSEMTKEQLIDALRRSGS